MALTLAAHCHVLGSSAESLEGMEVDTHVRFFTFVREGDPRLQVV